MNKKFELDEAFESFLDDFYNYEGFGPAIKSAQPNQQVIDKYHRKLPDRLLEYWQEYGFCGWGEGIFWTVNPDDYEDILQTWLEGTPLIDQDQYYVIGRSAFGKLFVWGEKSGQSIKIISPYGMIFPTDESEDLKNDGADKTLDYYYMNRDKEEMDIDDPEDNPLFKRALEKLGPLEADEMYGFVPALALGGTPKLENLQIVKATEHLAFLADLGEKQVMADIVALSNSLHQN